MTRIILYPTNEIMEHLVTVLWNAFFVLLDPAAVVATLAVVRGLGIPNVRIGPLVLVEELAYVLRQIGVHDLLVHGYEYLREAEVVHRVRFRVLNGRGGDFLEKTYQVAARLRGGVDAHHLALFALDFRGGVG